MSNPKNYPELLAVISAVKKEVAQKLAIKLAGVRPMFNSIPAFNFFHGTFDTHDFSNPIAVIYFSDIQTGIFAICPNMWQTELFRFSLVEKRKLKLSSQH